MEGHKAFFTAAEADWQTAFSALRGEGTHNTTHLTQEFYTHSHSLKTATLSRLCSARVRRKRQMLSST